MPVTQRLCYGITDYTRIELEVLVAGMTITVKAGSFKHLGTDYELAADEVFALAPSSYERNLTCLLVRHEPTGQADVLFDEYEKDGVHEAAQRPRDWPYAVLEQLFFILIPPNTTDLSGLAFDVLYCPPPPPEEP